MNPFSILMFCFSGGIALYVGILALSKDPHMIPKSGAAGMKNPRAYAVALAKMLAVEALAPLGSGIYALIHQGLGMAMLIVNFILCTIVGLYAFNHAEK